MLFVCIALNASLQRLAIKNTHIWHVCIYGVDISLGDLKDYEFYIYIYFLLCLNCPETLQVKFDIRS